VKKIAIYLILITLFIILLPQKTPKWRKTSDSEEVLATMADNEGNEEQEKGFVVKDRRFTAKKQEEEPAQPDTAQSKEEAVKDVPHDEPAEQETSLPEITFPNLLFSLSTSALIQLGEIQDPMSRQTMKNLPLAKQTIDLIGMLKEKTKGNLTSDEEKLMENMLYDLKMRYVKAAG
jgi:hypothetical protein